MTPEHDAEWGDAVAAVAGCAGPPTAEVVGRLIAAGDASIGALVRENAALREHLEGLKTGSCWCGVGIGNPMFQGRHTERCAAVATILREAEK